MSEAKKKPPVGLECRTCGCRDFYVRNTIQRPGWIKRYRECRYCGRILTTMEVVGVKTQAATQATGKSQ